MDISLGFIVIVTLILIPGLIFRRLYFYGEFSKQFNAGLSLINQVLLSVIPGISIFIIVFFTYHYLFTKIELELIINKIKEINNQSLISADQNHGTLVQSFIDKTGPFISFLYLISAMFGAISGRVVRISKLDRRFKLLRFRNYWFYLLNGEHYDFKKFKHLKQEQKKHLFTKADILVEQNSDSTLFSGIVVDYELSISDGITLSKLFLQNAERYKLIDGEKKPISIPGNLFVVDCSNMKNINLTYIYEDGYSDSKNILKSKIPGIVDLCFGILFIALIPPFIFKIDSISFRLYKEIFSLDWFRKIFAYFFVVQFLGILYPFSKQNDEYKFVTLKLLIFKIISAFILFFIAFL